MARFRYVPVSSPLHDAASVERLLAGLAADLRAADGTSAGGPGAAGGTSAGGPGAAGGTSAGGPGAAGGTSAGGPGAAGGPSSGDGTGSPLALVVLTGGSEQAILHAAATRAAWEPIVVVAHPLHNSLPAALEAVARLHQDGRPARIVYLDGGPRARAALAQATDDIAVAQTLHRLRIGLVGAPSDWLVASSPAPEVVRETWGPQVVAIDIDEALAEYERTAPAAGAALASAVLDGAIGTGEPDGAAVAAASRVHPVLTGLVRRHRLDALSVRCFDLVTRLGTSGCLALAELNDAGVTAGCEGDLPSTIAMIWTRLLLGEVPWMANPAQIHADEELLVLAHCTVARSLTTGYRIRSHFESGLGAALAGSLAPGPVTLVRIGGRRLERHWVAEGVAVARPHREGLCRTQLSVHLPPSQLDTLLAAPLGNHLVVVPGHHRERLSRWLSETRAPITA